MGDSVEAARRRQRGGQRHREINVVDDDLRQHLGRAHGLLRAALGLPEDRRHLRSRVGRRDDELRQIRAQRDGLAKTRGRAAAERDGAIGLEPAHGLERALRDIDGRVHRRLGEDARAELAKRRCERARGIGLLRRCEDERAAPEPARLLDDPRQRSKAEDNARGMAVVDEALTRRLKFELQGLPHEDSNGRASRDRLSIMRRETRKCRARSRRPLARTVRGALTIGTPGGTPPA